MTAELTVAPRTDLMSFTEEARATHAVAQALASTSFVPASMKNKPDEITGAILFGKELGMSPMTALQTINVIQGRPTLTANAMRGLAMAAGVKFRLDESTETRCVMSAKAPGQEQWTPVTWTIDQARKLGLTNKENWKNQPSVMLIARATSQLCRLVAANVLIGLPYSLEELSDIDAPDSDGPSVNTNPDPEKKTRRISRATVKAVVGEEPEPEEQPSLPAAAEETRAIESGGVPDQARKAIMAAFGELAKSRGDSATMSRDERLTYVSKVIGREVVSVNQLNDVEARRLLSHLRNDIEGWPTTAPVPGE